MIRLALHLATPLTVAIALVLPTMATAGACPNEGLRQGPSANLPDCRAYEQVSPTEKNLIDAEGKPNNVQSSPTGSVVRYYSFAPFPNTVGASDNPQYLSSRHGESDPSWLTEGVLPESAPGKEAGIFGYTSDLSGAIIFGEGPALAQGALGASNTYLRDSATGGYQTLIPGFGRENVHLAGAAASGHVIIFESTESELIPGVPDPSASPNLYEWSAGHLSLVAEDAVLGGGDPRVHYNEGALSTDGARLFFTRAPSSGVGAIFARENGGTTLPVSAGPAHFLSATLDGRYVFYTETKGFSALTWTANLE